MTCIVGIKDETGVWLGADSYCGNGDRCGLVAQPKIFRLHEPNKNDPILIATCGSAWIHQLLRHSLDVPPMQEGQDVMRYLIGDFRRAMRSCLKGHGVLQKRQGEDYFDGSALLAIQDRLFVLTNGITFEENQRDFFGFAAGGEYACGSLWHTRGQPAPDRLRMALETATEMNAYVCGPFHIEKL